MKPLEMAIQMEVEGKAFYQAASRRAGDRLGQDLFARLAKEEDFHAAKAREIADALAGGETPMAIEESLDRGVELRSIFAEATNRLVERDAVASTELDAIDDALDLEEKSRQFYEERSLTAETEFERRFFGALVGEERGHYLSLVDYREYLTDPAGWFTRTEHHSLDGG